METLTRYLDQKNISLFIDSASCSFHTNAFVNSLYNLLVSFDEKFLDPIVAKIQEINLLPEDISHLVYKQIGDCYSRLFLPLQEQDPSDFHRCLARLIQRLNIRHIVTVDIDNRLEKALNEEGLQAGRDFLVLIDKGSWQNWQEDTSLPTIFKISGCLSSPESITPTMFTREQGLGVFPRQAIGNCLRSHALYLSLHRWRPYLHMFLLEAIDSSSPGLSFATTGYIENYEKMAEHQGLIDEVPEQHILEKLARLCQVDTAKTANVPDLYFSSWGEELTILDVYYIIGDLASFAEKEHLAILCWEKAEEVAKGQMHPGNIAYALARLGASYCKVGRSMEALSFFEKSLEIAQRLGNQQLLASVYTHLGKMYSEKSNPVLSVKHYKRGIDVYEKIGMFDAAADTHIKCGELYERKGMLGEAINSYENGRQLYQKTGKVSQLGRVNNFLGRVYFQKMDWEQAKEHYQKGLDLSFACADIVSIARIYSNLGVLAQQYSKGLQDSLFYYKRAREIFRQTRDPKGLSTVEFNLSLVAR